MTASALAPLEVAAGRVWGFHPGLSPLAPDPTRSPLEALDEILVGALERQPCVVSFSGGRDSSAVLAVAVESAKRHGLPLPLPVTLRFPHDPNAEESDWQESVIDFLGLDDWVKIEIFDQFDIIGRYAAPLMHRHGVMYPFNAFAHAPVAAHARNGTVLTGVGGDEMFTRSRWRRVNELRTGTSLAGPRDLARLALAYGPPRLRGRVETRRFVARQWLTADAERQARSRARAMSEAQAVEWDRSALDTWWRSRVRYLVAASLDLVGQEFGACMIHPLAHPTFIASIAAFGGERGFPTRSSAMSAVFGDLLPAALLSRSTKAHFQESFWGAESRRFAADWDGGGVDRDLVRVDRLRDLWRGAAPHAGSMLLFQSAWLASQVSESVRPTGL